MKKVLYFFILLTLLLSTNSFAQLTGTKAIPGDYATIADAVTALNTSGVGAGGVTFNVAANHTESTTTGITITATSVSGNPIVFQKSGTGNNPLITRTDAGTNATSALGGLGDAIIRLDGTDYITFDGISVTASDAGIEYGFYTHKPSATDGCQNVTIKNAVVTMTKGTSAYVMGIYIGNGATSVSSATGVTVTAESGRNANIVITGNTVQNVHAGIYVRGSSATGFYDNGVTVGAQNAGNIIQNFGGASATSTYGVYFIYVLNPKVEYNTIDNANGGTAHGSTLYGVFYSTVSGDVAGNNNTITLSNSSASSSSQGLYSSNTVTSENYNNNTFKAGTISSTGAVYLIYASNATNNKTITGNQTSGAINRTGASGNFYGYYNLGSPTGGTETISNNIISNVTLSGTSAFYGLYSNTTTSPNRIASGNTVSNITNGTGSLYGVYMLSTLSNTVNDNIVRDITSGGTVYALYFSGTNPTVYNNKVYNVSTTGTTAYGIYNGGTGTTNCYKNQVYNMTVTNAGAFLYGIIISSGTANYVYNNFISELKTPTANSNAGLAGIYASGGTAIGLYFNTIFLNATSSGANFGSSGINASSTPALDLRNNIITNLSTAAGTGFTVAYRRSSVTLTNYGSLSDNNLFYAGTPSATNLIYFDGTAGYQTLNDFKTLVAPREASSVTENPTFINTTTPPYNLHVSTTTPTLIEGGGTGITSPIAITTDFDGDTRGTSPDIGADEFTGVRPNLPPAISITPKSKDFGSAQTGTSTSDFQFTVKNSGGGILPVSGISFLSGSSAVFVKTDTNTYPKNLAGGESMVFSVKFSPADTGAAVALLAVNYTYPTELVDTISLSGYGYNARITAFPYTNSFDVLPFPPLGWSTSVTSGSYLFERVTSGTNPTVTPHSGAAMLTFKSYSSSAGTGAILITPQVNLPSSDFRFRFWMYRDSTYATNNDRVVVYVNSTPSLTGADSIGGVSRYRGTDPALNGWYEYILTFPSGFQGNGKHIILKTISAYGGNMYFDDFTIEQIPAQPLFAINPTSKNFGEVQVGQFASAAFTVSNTGAGALTLNAPVIQNPGEIGVFTLADTNTYPKTLGNGQSLTFNAKFTPTDTSAQSAVISITHNAAGSPTTVPLSGKGVDYTIANFPYFQNFDSTGGVFPPPGWQNINGYWARGTEAYSLPYCAKISYNYSSTVPGILQTPPVNLPPFAKISFWWKDDDITKKLTGNGELAVNDDPKIIGNDTTFFEISTDGGSNWTTLAFLSAAASQTAYGEQIADLSAYAGNNRLLRWRDKTNASFSAYGTGLDNIKIEVVPQILIDWYNLQWPLTATISEGGSVTVYAQAWENGITPNPADTTIKCWIGYSTTNTDPATWTNWKLATFNVVSGNNNEYKADIGSNLAAGTYYYASRFQLLNGPYTYGGCSASSGGPWNGTSNISGVLTVNPVVVSQFPMIESFENNFPPTGWKIVDVNGLPTWTKSTAKPRTGLASASYNYSSSLPGNDWLMTPAISLQAGKAYRVAYGYAVQGATYPENFRVKIGSAPVPDSMTVLVADHPSVTNTAYQLGGGLITVPVSGNYYIGIQCYSLPDQWTLYVDDFVFSEVYPVDYAVATISQVNGIPTFDSEVSTLNKNEAETVIVPDANAQGAVSGIADSKPTIGNDIFTGIPGEAPTAIIPVEMKALIANIGLTAPAYNLDYSIAGVAGSQINRPGVPAGSIDTVTFGTTPANRGTFTTAVNISAVGDTIGVDNNSLSYHRTLVYPDSNFKVRYDNGTNTPNTFIGFGTNNIALWGAVRMNASANMRLTNIDAFHRNENSPDSVLLGIWGAGADSLAPGPLLYVKKFGGINYNVPGTSGAYITLPLGDDAPGFQAGQTFWVSLVFNAAVQFPLGAHNSPLTNTGRSFVSQDSGKTWLPLIVTTERAWLVRAVGVNWAVPAMQPVWEKSTAKSNLPSWFSTTGSTERGMAYGYVNGNHRLYVVSRNAGTNVRVLNANTGNDVGTLNVSGIAGGTYLLNDIGVTIDGKIFAGNLLNALTDTFRVYMWNDEASAPVKVIDFVETVLARLGDKITVTGDYSNNTAVIWASSSTNAVPKVYRWTMTGGAFNAVPEEILLSDNAVGSTASVGPIPGNGFYLNSNGQSAKHYSITGQLLGTIPGTVVATGSNAIRWLSQTGGKDYFATFQYGAGNENARVVGVPGSDYANAFTFGLTPSMRVNANANGTGDLDVRRHPDGAVDVFVLSTNNGIGVYRTTQIIPVELSAFGATVSGREVTLNWTTVTELNNSGFSIERKTLEGEYKTVAFVEGKGNTTELTRYSYIDKSVQSGSYIYRLKQVDFDGTYAYSNEVKVDVSVPDQFYLAQNYPNPFNPSTVIKYSVPADGLVTLGVYNVLGERVATLVNQIVKAGTYEVSFDASALPTGVYIYKMESGSFSSVKKMMLVK